jgi:4-hydroxy-tetrahydrodipicolinate reductase
LRKAESTDCHGTILEMTTDIVIIGSMGAMGREIASCVLDDKNCRLAGCVESPGHPSIGRDYGESIGRGTLGIRLASTPADLPVETSVVIDFSSPAGTMAFLDSIGKRKTRIVIGTTGITPDGVERIKAASEIMPVVFSPNMSRGVNLLFALTELAAQKLGRTFDIEIVEAHHRFKKDSPSGTAVRLGEIAASSIGMTYDEAVRNGRTGMVGARSDREIGMHAVRGGDIVGDHTVLFAGLGERLELRHVATSKSTFARGAVAAAQWLAMQKPGLYTMRDVLGL